MRRLSAAGEQAINDIARRHGFGVPATLGMLDAVISGGGGMAQFDHPEFAGYGQWMRGGMTMVSDMFNSQLKGRVDALCIELSNLVAREADATPGGSDRPESLEPLFVQTTGAVSGDWWPADLRLPNSAGTQNDVRYAYFAAARRLAIDVGGTTTVYDTLDHQIGGFSQQQSVGGSISFSSQHGPIDVATLPVVSSKSDAGKSSSAPPGEYRPIQAPEDVAPPKRPDQDVFATIEKLADLRAKGFISDEEFSTKKTELLGRV